ncbi:CBO0543 family protein [Paenibacillus sp. S-38]|uniref:CBO0543 family protein n=1 Tax=Paenibacillus sp. S-38 TaxID=3416710 RepID=UPI003CF18E34
MLTIVRPYMPLILSIVWLIAAWRFGDWRNWRKYYPSTLFTVVVSLVIFTLQHNHPLWKFHGAFLFPNRTLHEHRINFSVLPPICLLFLTFYRYRSGFIQQFLYITFWVVILSLTEAFVGFAKFLTYHNGWSIWWSVAFWYLALSVIRLHYSKPLLASLVSLGLIIFGLVYFKIPISKLD